MATNRQTLIEVVTCRAEIALVDTQVAEVLDDPRRTLRKIDGPAHGQTLFESGTRGIQPVGVLRQHTQAAERVGDALIEREPSRSKQAVLLQALRLGVIALRLR